MENNFLSMFITWHGRAKSQKDLINITRHYKNQHTAKCLSCFISVMGTPLLRT